MARSWHASASDSRSSGSTVPQQGDRLLAPADREVHPLAGVGADPTGPGERVGPGPGIHRPLAGQGRVEPAQPLLPVPAHPPRPAHPADEALRGLGVLLVDEPRERGAEVVALAGDLGQPGDLVLATERRRAALGEREVVRGMTVSGVVRRLGRGQALPPEQRERLEEVEPGLAVDLVGDHQGLVDEVGQQVGDVLGLDLVAGAHGLGRLQRATAGEDGEQLEHPPLVVEQQVVAPLHHGAEGLLPGQRRAGAAGQEPEAIVEAVRELLHGDHAHAGGRQLDRQREPVEARADVLDDGAGIERALGRASGAGAVGEELDRIVDGERGHGPDRLPAEPEGLAARRQDAQLRAVHEQLLDHPGRLADDVLAVVHDHDRSAGRPGARPVARGPPVPRLGRAPASRSPMPTATASGTAAGSCTGASSTRNASCSSSLRASSWARRVFPAPPGPTIVTSRWARDEATERREVVLPPDEAAQARGDVGPAGEARPLGLRAAAAGSGPGRGWRPRGPAAPDPGPGRAPRRAPCGRAGRRGAPRPADPLGRGRASGSRGAAPAAAPRRPAARARPPARRRARSAGRRRSDPRGHVHRSSSSRVASRRRMPSSSDPSSGGPRHRAKCTAEGVDGRVDLGLGEGSRARAPPPPRTGGRRCPRRRRRGGIHPRRSRACR